MPMRTLACLLVAGSSWAFFAGGSVTAQGPVDTVKSFSAIQQIDLNRLLGGDILVERGPLMNFPNGISGQTCFAVPIPAEQTAKRLQVWDPSPHADLKVYAFRSLPVPCALADFQHLDFRSSQYPIRWLLDKTFASTSARSELNLTQEEAEGLASCVPKRTEPQRVAGCWANLLFNRATGFQQKGLADVPPYEVAGQSVSPVAQLRTAGPM